MSSRILILVSVLILPTATAEIASAEFITEGTIEFAAQTHIEGRIRALLFDDASEMTSFLFQSANARVCYFVASYAESEIAGNSFRTPLSKTSDCWWNTNVAVRLAPDIAAAGWVGISPSDITPCSFDLTSLALSARPSQRSVVATPEAQGRLNDTSGPEDSSYYREVVEGAHLLVTGRGDVEAACAGRLLLSGPTVIIESRENTTRYETGESAKAGELVGERTLRWITIAADDGVFEAAIGSAFTVALDSIENATWDGAVRLHPVGGLLQTAQMTYPAGDAEEVVVGTFTGSSRPSSDGGTTLLRASGDLRTTSIAAAPRPDIASSAAGSGLNGSALAVVAGVLAGGASWMIWRSRRKAGSGSARSVLALPESLAETPQQRAATFAMMAEEEADAGRWNIATELLRRSRECVDGDPRQAMKLGIYLYMEDRFAEAIEEFESAARLGSNGEAETWAAASAIAMKDFDIAEQFVLRALDRDPRPELVMDLRVEATFSPLLLRENVRRALRDADPSNSAPSS